MTITRINPEYQAKGSYAAASHTHAASDMTSGQLDIARIPTGTTSSTVALGNHSHRASTPSVSATAKSGFSVTASAFRTLNAAKLFGLTVKNTSALTAGTTYEIATLPWTSGFGVVVASSNDGCCAVTAAGVVQYTPVRAKGASGNIYVRGVLV